MADKDQLQRLMTMKTNLENAKSRKSEMQGQLKQIMKSLKDDFDCSTIEEAQEKLRFMQGKKEKLEVKFRTDLARLEADYANATRAR